MVCVGVAVKRSMYQRKVDVDMLNAVKSVLADVSSVSPSSEQRVDQFVCLFACIVCTVCKGGAGYIALVGVFGSSYSTSHIFKSCNLY